MDDRLRELQDRIDLHRQGTAQFGPLDILDFLPVYPFSVSCGRRERFENALCTFAREAAFSTSDASRALTVIYRFLVQAGMYFIWFKLLRLHWIAWLFNPTGKLVEFSERASRSMAALRGPDRERLLRRLERLSDPEEEDPAFSDCRRYMDRLLDEVRSSKLAPHDRQ